MIRSKTKQENKQKEREIKEKEKEREKLQKEKEKEREKESKKESKNVKEGASSHSHVDSQAKVSAPVRNDTMLRSFRKGYVEMRYRNSWKYIYVILIGGSFYMYHNSTVCLRFRFSFCFFLILF